MEKQNLINWGVFTPADREEVGSVHEIAGPNATLGLIRTNYDDTTKRLVVILKNETGESAAITCSSAVSDAVRSNKITLKQLFGFTIFKQVNSDTGEEYPLIGMPSGNNLMEFKIAEPVAYEPTVVSAEDLVAYE